MNQRVAIYARVSTLHSQNPEMQLAELREYASRRGWEVAAEYVDLGVSGSRESRPNSTGCSLLPMHEPSMQSFAGSLTDWDAASSTWSQRSRTSAPTALPSSRYATISTSARPPDAS